MSDFFKAEDESGHKGWPIPPWWAYVAVLLLTTAGLILVNNPSK